ncbi:MAG TPA: hypothetical protein VK174_09300, partial [Chitinophagales bacterium]|nr:hypothetical protein [Chitinophagales bacterium]
YHRLALSKIAKGTKPLIAFSSMLDGLALLRRLIDDFELCARLTGLATDTAACETKKCVCTKRNAKSIIAYNSKVHAAIEALSRTESFIITQQGRTKDEAGVVVVERGSFTRMGYLPLGGLTNGIKSKEVLESIPLYRENFNIRNIISGYKRDFPHTVIQL